MTSTIGVMQFVVQLAQEMMAGVPPGTFTPWTTVSTSSLFDGADRRTNRAPARACFSRSSRRVSAPVHSNTSSTPSSFQGRSNGSRVRSVRNLWPATTRSSPSATTGLGYRPYTVSKRSR